MVGRDVWAMGKSWQVSARRGFILHPPPPTMRAFSETTWRRCCLVGIWGHAEPGSDMGEWAGWRRGEVKEKEVGK